MSMTTADPQAGAPADTILARCNEVLERHTEGVWVAINGDHGAWCNHCKGDWPCDASLAVRDLRDAVEALKDRRAEYSRFPWPCDEVIWIDGVLATIAQRAPKRGEAQDGSGRIQRNAGRSIDATIEG